PPPPPSPAPAPAAVADAAPPPPPAAPPAAAPAPPPPKAKPAAVVRATPTEKPRAAPAASGPSADELYRDGTRLYLKGQLAEARKKYESALAQNSRYPAAHRGLGFVYQRLGDRARALRHLKRYLELSPRAGDAAEVKKRIDALGG
ncbi:MAG TPA: tetratricopeptide repeat protein, partial [Kofleriaceae bacterium]|nr:tetratricopeptide repeat protein [Kofleriaceae bacterium]